MSTYFVKPIVCDYAVYEVGNPDMICMCNIRSNAELIADILNADLSGADSLWLFLLS